ncbi:MAG TPA: hypothetical protein VFT95_20395, partial [Micromonosporaceae bacterium]|nr:hypothetical protein [Micromonosporaceae bacterium]
MTGETLRRVRQSAGLFALLALLALAASLLATGMPRAVNRLTDDALRADVARLPHPARDLMLTTRFDTLLEIPESDVPIDLADGEGRLASYERGLPAPLPGLIGQRWFAASVGPPGVTTIVPSGPRTELGLRVQTGVREASRLTAGRWPASEPGGAAEVAVSETIATKLGLAPGRTLELGGPAGGVVVVVVGIWAPRDAGEPVWDDMPLALDTPWPMPEAPFQAVAVTDPVGLTTAARALRQLRYAWRYRVDERRLDGALLDRAIAAATTARRVPPRDGLLAQPVVTSTGL